MIKKVEGYRSTVYNNILQTYQNLFFQYHYIHCGYKYGQREKRISQQDSGNCDDAEDLHDGDSSSSSSSSNNNVTTTTTAAISKNDGDWLFQDLKLPPFLLEEFYNVGHEGRDVAEEVTIERRSDNAPATTRRSKSAAAAAAHDGANASTFHDEWIRMLPPSSKRLIPNGCNLYGIDLEDEGSWIQCFTFDL